MRKVFLFLYPLFLPITAFAQRESQLNIKNEKDVIKIIIKIVGILYTAFWVIAVGAIVWAAFLFLTAGGEEEKVSRAKKMLFYAVIASVVALLAVGINSILTNVLSP